MGIFDFLKRSKNVITDNGKNTTYYEKGKGKLREVFYKKEGVLNGEYCEKFIWGSMKQVGNYKKGKKNGKWIYNAEAGYSAPKLKNDLLIGTDNPLAWVVHYKNGIIDGQFERYKLIQSQIHGFQMGDIKYEKVLIEQGHCINGLKEGEWEISIPQIKKLPLGSQVDLKGEKGMILEKLVEDVYTDVFVDYTRKYKIKYVKGVLTENTSDLSKALYPQLNLETPEILINNIVDNNCDDSEENRYFQQAFIDRSDSK